MLYRMIRKPQTASFPDNDIRPDNYRSIMDAVQVPHLLDEGGFLQGVIPIGWRDRFYHWVRRWFAVFLPVSLLFLLFFWLRCGRPRKRKRYAIGEAALPPEEEFNAICSAPGKTVRLVYLQVRCWVHTAAHMHGNQVVCRVRTYTCIYTGRSGATGGMHIALSISLRKNNDGGLRILLCGLAPMRLIKIAWDESRGHALQTACSV